MTGMRAQGSITRRPFSREEIKIVLDLLEYDSRARKIEDAAAFEKSGEELKRRFARAQECCSAFEGGVGGTMRSRKKAPAAVHSQKPELLRWAKDRRHGILSWTTWLERARTAPTGQTIRPRRG